MNKTDGSIVCQLVNNFRFPIFFPRENIEFALNYKPENCDKFLATYPKCGVTWTQQIICLIINNGMHQNYDKQYIFKSFIELSGKESLNTLKKPRVIKTHLPFDLIPYNKSAKYLCVLRNPKDTCVSNYFHDKALPDYHINDDFHDYFRCWINGKVDYGDYFQHVLSFWSHRSDDNFTFLIYENMKNNLRDPVLKIGKFLGYEFVVKLKENNEFLLNKVIENSTVDSMKSFLGESFKHKIRKGIVGDWRNHFNKAESDLVDEKVEKLFAGTGLESLWSKEMKW
jgi:hypothetical protein